MPMPHPADLVLDANYNGPFAVDAEYFAPGIGLVAGQGLACRVMRGGRQAGLDIGGTSNRPVVDEDTFKVRVRELARPRDGGVIYLTDARTWYKIMGVPETFDRHRREWTMQAMALVGRRVPLVYQPATSKGRAGQVLRMSRIDAPAFGRGHARAPSLADALNSPASAHGRSGSAVRRASLHAGAVGTGRAFDALEAFGNIILNAPAIGHGRAGGLVRRANLRALANGDGVAGNVLREIRLDAPVPGAGRAFAALEGVRQSDIEAAASGAGIAGGVVRLSSLSGAVPGQGVAGALARVASIYAPAFSAGSAGAAGRASFINVAAAGRGMAADALEAQGVITLNAPASGRALAGTLMRVSQLADTATGAGRVAGALRGIVLDAPADGFGRALPAIVAHGAGFLDAPATGRAAAGTLLRAAAVDAGVSALAIAGGLLRRASLQPPASATARAGSAQRGSQVNSAATGGALARSPRRNGLILAPAAGAGAAGSVVGEAGGPAFDAFTIHAWNPLGGADASGSVPDAVGSRSLWAVNDSGVIANWNGTLAQWQALILDASDAASVLEGSPRTLTFWRNRSAASSEWSAFSSFGDGYPSDPSSQGSWQFTDGPGGAIYWLYRVPAGWGAGLQTDGQVTNDAWQFFALTINGSDWRVYINGVQHLASTTAATLSGIGHGLTFGHVDAGEAVDHVTPFSIGGGFVGQFGDIRIHNRHLTAVEIGALYSAGRLAF